ncbi:MAG: hypothetical protein RXN79_03460 [Candidatus Nanopusillus sp.]
MVLKDLIEKIRDSISGQSIDNNTYYTVCKKSKPPEVYEEKLEDVSKMISEVAPEARPSLEKLLNRMKNLGYSLISRDVKSEYGPIICSFTHAFYYGILDGIYQAVFNNIFVLKGHERLFNIQENIDNSKTALEYLASGDILERFFKAYLKKVEEKFYNETGYHVSELLRIKALMNNIVKYAYSIKTLTDLSLEEAENVANITENLVKHPEKYKKDFEEYIGYKS